MNYNQLIATSFLFNQFLHYALLNLVVIAPANTDCDSSTVVNLVQVIPLHLPPGDAATERTLHIDGTSEQIKTARELVDEVISEVCLDVDVGRKGFLSLNYFCLSSFT